MSKDKEVKKGPKTKDYVYTGVKTHSYRDEDGELQEASNGDTVALTDGQYEAFKDKFRSQKQLDADEAASNVDGDEDETPTVATGKVPNVPPHKNAAGVSIKSANQPAKPGAGASTTAGKIGDDEDPDGDEDEKELANSRSTARATGNSTDKPSGKTPT
jgi:hypothetical protein